MKYLYYIIYSRGVVVLTIDISNWPIYARFSSFGIFFITIIIIIGDYIVFLIFYSSLMVDLGFFFAIEICRYDDLYNIIALQDILNCTRMTVKNMRKSFNPRKKCVYIRHDN